MENQPTYENTATNWELWCEYVDTGATMTQEQFNAMTTEEKVKTQIEIWGPEVAEDEDD